MSTLVFVFVCLSIVLSQIKLASGVSCSCTCRSIFESRPPQPAIPVPSCSQCNSDLCMLKYPSVCSLATNQMIATSCSDDGISATVTSTALTTTRMPPSLSSSSASSGASCTCTCCLYTENLSCTPIAQPVFSVSTCSICTNTLCASTYPPICRANGTNYYTEASCREVSSAASAISSSFIVKCLFVAFGLGTMKQMI